RPGASHESRHHPTKGARLTSTNRWPGPPTVPMGNRPTLGPPGDARPDRMRAGGLTGSREAAGNGWAEAAGLPRAQARPSTFSERSADLVVVPGRAVRAGVDQLAGRVAQVGGVRGLVPDVGVRAAAASPVERGGGVLAAAGAQGNRLAGLQGERAEREDVVGPLGLVADGPALEADGF